ncbi:MAG: alpha/beta hydrolase family protein [Gammaproteobacteria bacterium]
MRSVVASVVGAVSLTACAGLGQGQVADTELATTTCAVGIFGSGDAFVAITKRGSDYRYSHSDGNAGTVGANGRVICESDAVVLDQSIVLARREVRITNTRFDAAGAVLAGQLMEPENAGPATPLIVYAHGSERLGWIGAATDPYQMVGRGVSVFVYDKRGTGDSTGAYSQNFPQLADDLVAAAAEAQRLAAGRFGRFGLFGLSQGGWIAPLAATRANADFLGIGYGLVVDILEEDASQVELELTEAGFGEQAIVKARQLTDVTARLAVSNYTDGLDDLDRLRELYREQPWYSTVRGGFTGVILGLSSSELRTKGIPMFDELNIDWSLNPMQVLREVDVPQLWVLAAEDREAPFSKTLERLQTIREEGRPISIHVFPNTDHGMWEFDRMADGTRSYTRVTDGFYALMSDWAKGVSEPPYGRAKQQ